MHNHKYTNTQTPHKQPSIGTTESRPSETVEMGANLSKKEIVLGEVFPTDSHSSCVEVEWEGRRLHLLPEKKRRKIERKPAEH